MITMKKTIEKKVCKLICMFLNNLAYATKSSYSFVGPYNPKKPEKLSNSK